jgi:hypothetical protein
MRVPYTSFGMVACTVIPGIAGFGKPSKIFLVMAKHRKTSKPFEWA